jgi:hypothetical protein
MTTYPPDKCTLLSGAWNTDIELDTTTFLSGDASLLFKNTTPAANPTVVGEEQATIPGSVWLGEFVAQQSSIAAGNEIGCGIQWLDSAKSLISTDWTPLPTFYLPSINTWYSASGSATAPANTAYVRPTFAKKNNAFTANLDTMGIREVQPSFLAYLGGSQTVNSGATDKLLFDVEEYDYGGMYDNATNYRFVCSVPGTYMVSSRIRFSAMNDQNLIKLILKKGGSTYDLDERTVSGTAIVGAAISQPVRMAVGEYLEIFANHNFGASRTVQGIFSVTKL